MGVSIDTPYDFFPLATNPKIVKIAALFTLSSVKSCYSE
jgi:hypothetical protein